MNKWAVIALLALASTGRAQQLSMESAGTRFGFCGSQDAQKLHQAEGFANLNLPWRWNLGSQWFLKSRLDFSAGWLGDPGGDGFVGTAGPSLLLGRGSFPLSLEVGLSPTVLSEHHFEEKNLGSFFQFTSHVGLNFDFGQHWRLGYRFQHMSNAGFVHPNPGLNLHMIAASYLF